MNEVYAHMETIRKEQPAIRLRHISSGPNGCHCQPRSRFVEAKGKSNAELWQYKEDQFRALKDQLETSPTQISNLCGHNGNRFKNPFAEHQMHRRQHHHKLMPLIGWTGSNSRFQNFQGCYNLQYFGIGC